MKTILKILMVGTSVVEMTSAAESFDLLDTDQKTSDE